MILKKFTDIIPVSGFKRSVLLDLTRGKYFLVPNSLIDFLKEMEGETKESICQKYSNEIQILEEYFNFLEENEFIFACDGNEKDRFPEIKPNYFSPYQINNSIVIIGGDFSNLKNIVMQLDKLNCINVQFFLKDVDLLKTLEIINDLTIQSSIKHIELISKKNDLIKIDNIIQIMACNSRFSSIILHSSTKDEVVYQGESQVITEVIQTINDFKNCGNFNYANFNTNITLYTESLNHNTCLNRKISIDENGNIKNCPSLPENFGNINEITLEEALNKTGFKKYWNIKKDDVTVCKDCEFRHICSDCRAYTENYEDIYSKPLKCGYNPYTNEWEEWSTNPLKQKAIEYYGMSYEN